MLACHHNVPQASGSHTISFLLVFERHGSFSVRIGGNLFRPQPSFFCFIQCVKLPWVTFCDQLSRWHASDQVSVPRYHVGRQARHSRRQIDVARDGPGVKLKNTCQKQCCARDVLRQPTFYSY